MSAKKQATFGGGCFWCLEAVFLKVGGVKSVVSGYAGGQTDNPGYNEVCSGVTGHAEVVQIDYDSQLTSYKCLLGWFWRSHDPTTLNRQGADVGTQYRSVILFHDAEQESLAKASMNELDESNIYTDPIRTEISPLLKFYPAEDFHQDYYRNNPNAGYCQFIIRPKLQNLGFD